LVDGYLWIVFSLFILIIYFWYNNPPETYIVKAPQSHKEFLHKSLDTKILCVCVCVCECV